MRALTKFTPVDHNIAAKIKKFRTEKGMGLEQLAELTGLSFQQIQKYEKSINRITAAKLFEIAHILNKPIGAFFDGLEPQGKYYNYKIKSEKKRASEDFEISKELLPLIRSFNMIENKNVKKHLIHLMREIAGPFYRKQSKHFYS